MNKKPIVILISGRGSNMRSLIEHSLGSQASYSVSCVIADKADAPGLNVARELGIAARALPRAKGMERTEYDDALRAVIDESAPALVALAGFMHILSTSFVLHYAGRILNIHPSLLPRYTGLNTHRRALAAAECLHGATVHFVTDDLDGGARVIQARVPVLPNDTEASLSQRVLAREHVMYPRAVEWFCRGRLRYEAGMAIFDGQALSEPVQLDDIERQEASP